MDGPDRKIGVQGPSQPGGIRETEKIAETTEERVIKTVTQHENERTTRPSDERLHDLKPEINSLLVAYLPGNVTIGQADSLAMTIFDMITRPHKYLDPGENSETDG